jgi:hypothetical protein
MFTKLLKIVRSVHACGENWIREREGEIKESKIRKRPDPTAK